MKPPTVIFAATLSALLAGCSSGPPSPAGWQPAAGAHRSWTSGTGAAQQRYSYVRKSFGGTLQDLASQEAVNVVLRNRGAKFQSSNVFAPCPGAAAVADFTLGTMRTLQEGFAVRDGQAVLVAYTRPAGSPVDPAAAAAMEKALCVTAL